MGRRRESRWMQVYNDLIGIDQPHTIGFAGAGYGTYRRRFVNHAPGTPRPIQIGLLDHAGLPAKRTLVERIEEPSLCVRFGSFALKPYGSIVPSESLGPQRAVFRVRRVPHVANCGSRAPCMG